jgi:hypothetical protein
LPIPGLYTSTHNVVAYDLVSSAERCPPGSTPPLDIANLLRRAREDLDGILWSDRAERSAQYAILKAMEAQFGIVPAAPAPSHPLAELRGVRRLARWATRRRSAPTYESPNEAARAADRHYAKASS